MAVYSYSRLECFRRCPRQYYYRYLAKVPLEDAAEPIATFLGSRCHETLEHLYREVQRRRVPKVAKLLAYFRQQWDAAWTDEVVLHDKQTPAAYVKIGADCIRDYYRRFEPFDQARTVGLEKRVVFPLDKSGRHQMQGIVDRLAKTEDGVWQVHDYKTNKELPTQQDRDQDPQLAYYEIGIRRMWPAAEQIELYWHYLRFDHTINSTRTPAQLEELRRETIDVIQQIERRKPTAEAFPTHESASCRYCDYQHVCPVRKHLAEVRSLPPNRFAKEPGVKLVDHWADLHAARQSLLEQQRALDAEIDELKQALIALAAKKGLTTVVGTEKEVAVSLSETVEFPTKTHAPDDYVKFEAQLRKSPWWSDVSTLDRHALKRLWERRDELKTALQRLLAKFATAAQDTSVRLRNRRG